MLIIPAIDIKNGTCVRLFQGNFARETVYNTDPVSMATHWQANGAQLLHVIDLDGAREGYVINKKVIHNILQSVSIPIQVGGGIRDERTIDLLLTLGVKRVIIGTLAVQDSTMISKIFTRYGDQIAISLDCKNDKLVQKGWQEETQMDYLNTASELESIGIKRFIYTDIISDGTLTKPNLVAISQLQQYIHSSLIVGGGIASLCDVKKIKKLGVEGAIIGTALYENIFSLQEAIDVS